MRSITRARAKIPQPRSRPGAKPKQSASLPSCISRKGAKPRKRSWKADDNLLRRRVLTQSRNRAIADITRHDVRLLVEGIAEAGAPIVANRVAALCSKVFAFAPIAI